MLTRFEDALSDETPLEFWLKGFTDPDGPRIQTLSSTHPEEMSQSEINKWGIKRAPSGVTREINGETVSIEYTVTENPWSVMNAEEYH